MAAANPKLLDLENDDRHVLESMLVRFDQSWTEDSLAGQVLELPPNSRLRLPALVEMVKIDLERQWQRGRFISLEDYLSIYPELGTPHTVSADLIQAEYEVRCQFGRPVELSELARRFPGQAKQLEQLVERARQAASSRDLPRSETVSCHSASTVHPKGRAAHGAITGAVAGPSAANPLPRPDAAAIGQDWSVTQLPERFGRYHIRKCLGQGGMGAVYLAHDTQLDRQVAIKIPHFDRDDGPEVLQRFYCESRAAATLDHPNICPVYDVGEIDGVHFLVMAYIEGKPLSDFVHKDKPIEMRQVAAIVRKLALALQEAHTHGVVHRDLKPANIMANKRRELVIMDFGLARLMNKSSDSAHRLTQSGIVMGTPSYMSPEQVRGDIKAMGPACDVYSLGVIMYELLTGRLPFQGVLTAVLAQIMVDQPAPPSKHRPDIDPVLEAICLKAMAKKIEDRYTSMTDLAKALGDYLSSPKDAQVAAAAGAAGSPVIESSSSHRRAATRPALSARRLDPNHPADKPAMSAAPASGYPRPRDDRDRGRTPKPPVSVIGRVVDENLEQFFATAAEEETPLPRSRPSRPGPKPPWPWLAAGAAALLFLGGIIYVATHKGTIKIELNDPDAVVRVDGEVITIEQLGEPITLRAGEHMLVVTRGDIKVDARTFTVRRGNNPVLQVTLETTVARNDRTAVPPPAETPEVHSVETPKADSAASAKAAPAAEQPAARLSTGGTAVADRPSADNRSVDRPPPTWFKVTDDPAWPRNQWISLEFPPDVTKFNWLKNPRYEQGVLEFRSDGGGFDFSRVPLMSDGTVRVRVKPLSHGGNVGLSLRSGPDVGYYAFYGASASDAWMGIGWIDPKTGKFADIGKEPIHFKPLKGFFEFAFSAVGDRLTVTAGDKRFEVRDSKAAWGKVGLNAFQCRAQFKEPELKILDEPTPGEKRILALASANSERLGGARILQHKFSDWPKSNTDYALFNDPVIEVGLGSESPGWGWGATGIEIKNVKRIALLLTASGQFKLLGNDGTDCGFKIDYRTPAGYTKRVALSILNRTPTKYVPVPGWGQAGPPDQVERIGLRSAYDLDLQKWAPPDWDGHVWFNVMTQNTGNGTKLQVRLVELEPRL